MAQIVSKAEYEQQCAATRDRRMAWWREARFGMFIHYGLYSQLGRNEWVQLHENIPRDEYARLADTFRPREGICREWASQAKAAGMKYMVLTTRHHEGFSLWNSKVNPYNSFNACGRDIVAEFVDACREFGLGIGFYSSLMDWHHEDGYKCAYDTAARRRFLDYIEALNTELLTNYGKIDILWYDVPCPMENWEGWDSLERNQRLRELQPDIIINNRSRLPEDIGTPEGHVTAEANDWEACMTFNDISWGYVDETQATPYVYTAPRILKMLNTASAGGGNLLLNIGPAPDGSVPSDAVKPLNEVGKWLERNGEAVYPVRRPKGFMRAGGNGVCATTQSADGKIVYLWNWIWPSYGEMGFGGYMSAPESVTLIDGTPIDFVYKGQRILMKNLPKSAPDPLGVTIIKMTFASPPEWYRGTYYPQISGGYDRSGGNKI